MSGHDENPSLWRGIALKDLTDTQLALYLDLEHRSARGTVANQDLETRTAPFMGKTARENVKFCFSSQFEHSWMAECVNNAAAHAHVHPNPYAQAEAEAQTEADQGCQDALPNTWTWRRCAGMRLLEVALGEMEIKRRNSDAGSTTSTASSSL